MHSVVCSVVRHRPRTTEDRHPVGRDVIASRTDCTRCGKVLSVWPDPIERLADDLERIEDPTLPGLVPVSDLDVDTWTALSRRIESLPLTRVRTARDVDMLRIIETRASFRATRRLVHDPDQVHSIVTHYREAVEEKVVADLPDLHPGPVSHTSRNGGGSSVVHGRRRRVLGFAPGWLVWFSNRTVDLDLAIFRLRTFGTRRRPADA